MAWFPELDSRVDEALQSLQATIERAQKVSGYKPNLGESLQRWMLENRKRAQSFGQAQTAPPIVLSGSEDEQEPEQQAIPLFSSGSEDDVPLAQRLHVGKPPHQQAGTGWKGAASASAVDCRDAFPVRRPASAIPSGQQAPSSSARPWMNAGNTSSATKNKAASSTNRSSLSSTTLDALQKTNPTLAGAVGRLREQERLRAAAEKAEASKPRKVPLAPNANNRTPKATIPQTAKADTRPNWQAAAQIFQNSLYGDLCKPKKATQKISPLSCEPRFQKAAKTQEQHAESALKKLRTEEPEKRRFFPRRPLRDELRATPTKAAGVSSESLRMPTGQQPQQPDIHAVKRESPGPPPDPEPAKRSRGIASEGAQAAAAGQSEPATADQLDRSELRASVEPPAEPGPSAANDPLVEVGIPGHRLSEPDRKAVEDAEWELRQVEIAKQRVEAQKLKQQKREQALVLQRVDARLAEYKSSEAAKMQLLAQKDSVRAQVKAQLAKQLAGPPRGSQQRLLRALGVEINHLGGERSIAVALKRAAIAFHPDKHQTSPLDQQIYAEEVFKLISEAMAMYRPKQLQIY